MKHLRIFLPLILALAAALPARADKIPLADLSAYLTSITAAEASFTQINDDGTISTGTIYINRPGRIRFEYDPPDKSLVIAGQGEVVVLDAKSNAAPDRFPLVQTPLSIILKPTVDLARGGMVVSHASEGSTTTVTAQDPDHPDYGNIQLVFTGAPIELRQWIVTNASGQQTTVVLGGLKAAGNLSARLFDVEEELRRRGF